MKRGFADWPCSVARVAEIVGDAWTILIIRDAVQGLTRFDEFQRSLNLARNTLSDRLGKLVEAGFMTKRFYQDNPPRYEYLLTDMGKDFFPALAAMRAWGDRWLDRGEGAPVSLHHYPYGHELTTAVICTTCGESVIHDDVQFCVGPGYPDEVPPAGDIRGRLAEVPGGPGGRRWVEAVDDALVEGAPQPKARARKPRTTKAAPSSKRSAARARKSA